jgi:hypothetical protein
MKNCSKPFRREQNAVTFTVSSRRQQFCFILRQCKISDEVRKFFLRDLVWIIRGYVQENSGSLEVDGCAVPSGVFFSSSSVSSEKKTVGGFWNKQTFTARH